MGLSIAQLPNSRPSLASLGVNPEADIILETTSRTS